MANKYTDIALYGGNIKKQDDAIYQAVITILNTEKGGKFFDPKFGLKIDDYLFSIMDELDEEFIIDTLRVKLKEHDSRIQDVDISIVNDEDNNKRKLHIEVLLKDGTLFHRELYVAN